MCACDVIRRKMNPGIGRHSNSLACRNAQRIQIGFFLALQHRYNCYALKTLFPNSYLLSVCRWTVSMAGSVAGGGEARRGESMPQVVCLLPYAHDGQLPVAEHHHSSGWCPLQLAARFPAEQPHHRVTHGLLRL